MPPYETKCLQRIFNTTGLSYNKLADMITGWLSDAIKDTHFNDYDYTIKVGDELINLGIFRIFDDPRFMMSHILDRARIEMQFMVDPLLTSMIKIEWRVPVYRDDFTIKFVKGYEVASEKSKVPEIKKVIYNNPATIVFWSDHTKTVVQCQKGDDYDPEKGLALAIAKKSLGNTSRKLNDVLHKWEKEEE